MVRGWSATPEGKITKPGRPNFGAKVLLMNHVRRRATEPSIVVYYPYDERVDVVARADIEVTSRFEFVWSKHTRLMTISFACYPIHGQDYSVMISNPNVVFESLPDVVFESGKVLDWLRGRANQGISVSKAAFSLMRNVFRMRKALFRGWFFGEMWVYTQIREKFS